MKRKTGLYPGVADAENERFNSATRAKFGPDSMPDFIGGKPNYDKFGGWDAERTLRWLNID